jgi:hypothetical protein
MCRAVRIVRLPGLYHVFDKSGYAGEVGGGALEAIDTLPLAADSV